MKPIAPWAMLLMATLAASPLAAAELPARLRAMTAESFTASIVEEREAGLLILSTRAGFVPQPLSPIRALLSDNHLRAVIDPATATVRYELHQSILYWGEQRSYLSARLETPAGTRPTGLLSARHGERFCPNEDDWGRCALTKQVVFAIEERELRAIAGHDRPWRYRIDEAAGRHWEGLLSPAEAGGLLMATERRLRTLAHRGAPMADL